MSVSGLAGTSSGHCIHLHALSLRALARRHCALPQIKISARFHPFEGNCLAQSKSRCYRRQTQLIKCAMDASFGDAMNSQSDVFPRINIKDPYKRLGIGTEASEEEIQAARNFLIQRYAGHKPSVDAIEAAHDKIIMQKFYDRKRPKLNIKKKVRDMTQSRYVQMVMSRFRTPSDSKFIVMTSVAFLSLGVLTVFFPTEEGPTLQGWSFYLFMALEHLSYGICHPAYTERTNKFGSDYFFDNICASLGCFYISKVAFLISPSFCRLHIVCQAF